MLAKQILTNPPKTFESRFPDPDHPQVPTFYCNLRIPKCSDAWPIMTAPQGKRPLETEGKDIHSQDLVPSTVVEQWRVNYVNWDDTFDISIEGYWVCSNWDPSCIVLALAAHAFGPDNRALQHHELSGCDQTCEKNAITYTIQTIHLCQLVSHALTVSVWIARFQPKSGTDGETLAGPFKWLKPAWQGCMKAP